MTNKIETVVTEYDEDSEEWEEVDDDSDAALNAAVKDITGIDLSDDDPSDAESKSG